MFEHIKKRIIKNLIEEILCLNPTDLELIGHNLVSMIECKRMIHHGINKDYMPSGYTVDSFTDDSTIVVEYSAKKDYFLDSNSGSSSSFKKIHDDINHAIKHSLVNEPSKIYLISNQEEPPSFRSKFNETPIAQAQGNKIIIYDAREIAKLIYEQSIENAENANFYKQFFPGFSQDFDNYEYYGKVPARCEKHISDSGILNAIKNHFEQGQYICVLNGLSGSGKTQAAIDYIHHEGKSFTNYIWITGDDWPPNTSLNAIQRTRGGSPVNVAGIFNSSKTVLVIDSIERIIDGAQLSELTEGFKKGSIVLATSQITEPGNQLYLAIPILSEEVARRILGEDNGSISVACTKLVKACGFSPLILSTIRKMVELEGIKREELYAEVLNTPVEIPGADGLSIMRRILDKLNDSTLEALKKISNTGSSIHDLDFLKEFIGVFPRSSLQRLSILLPTSTPGIVKIHDLVRMSMQDGLNNSIIAEAINKYIEKNKGEMTPSVLRQIHLCYSQISEINAHSNKQDLDWLTYALLQVEGEKKYDIHTQIYNEEITSALNLSSVMCIIEAKEIHSYKIDDSEKRRIYYKQCADAYQKAFDESSQNDIKAELLHHQGKALRRCGQYEEALNCFLQLLKLKPHWHAAYGQIVLLGTIYRVGKQIKETGKEYISILLEDMLQDASSVPLRVSLAAIARLRSYPEVSRVISSRPEEVEKLASIIAMSSLEGFGQFYEAFVAFTSIFGYHHSLCCIRLVEALPEMLVMPPEIVDEGQWVSACEALTNTAIAANREDKSELFYRVSSASIEFARSISSKTQIKAYDARVVAKAYITANLPQDALEAISRVPSENIDHWILYRKAEAQLKINDNIGALECAKEAYNLAKDDPKIEDRISIYHELKSKCYEQLGDKSNALLEARIALEKCTDSQYKNALQERVAILE
jgi:tetratricopeptide (TPR) repeat protein